MEAAIAGVIWAPAAVARWLSSADEKRIPMSAAASTPAAVAAFLRGVERRAALLAELQCGDPHAGDAALGATIRAFRRGARRQPLAQWPQQFWGLLLAAPQLRRTVPATERALSWRPLAALGNGQRAALLLRLVAGLDQEEAAVVLGVTPSLCREAVRQALLLTAEGRSEGDTWSDWEAAFQHGLRTLPAARLAQLARLREQAVESAPVQGRMPAALPHSPPRFRRWWPATMAVAGLCALALTATFLRPGWFARGTPANAGVRTEALPPAEAPSARFDDSLRAWSHRDFELLADPEGLRVAEHLPLLAWYMAQRATQPATDAGTTATASPPDAAQPAPVAALPVAAVAVSASVPPEAQAVIGRMPAPLQRELRIRAARWAALTPAQRTQYAQRARRWDALPHAVRAEQRERYSAWRALDPAARAQLTVAAQAFGQLAPEQREGLRANFMAQDAAMQRGWLLGPALGADYPRLQPLIAQLPESEHLSVLRVLRRLTPSERSDLAMLAQRTPPQERAELLRALVSTADMNRAAWLQARVAR